MSTLDIAPNGYIEKDPNEQRVIQFDWDENLADAAQIDVSEWDITVERPSTEDPIALDQDNDDIANDGRSCSVRIIDGTIGSLYKLTNRITTDETPAQIKERSIFVCVVDQ